MSNRLTEEAKLQCFKSLLREEAIEVYQGLFITTETTLKDSLKKFRKNFQKDDLKKIPRYKWEQAKHDPTAKPLTDFLKCFKIITEQAFVENPRQHYQTFLIGKLEISIKQF